MSTSDWIAILLGVTAVGGQAANLVMYLRIRVAVLESEKQTSRECDEKFVTNDICKERHGHCAQCSPEPVRIR